MLAKRLFVGAGSRLVITGVNIVIAFLMTPFILRHLGDEAYGLWVLVSVISSFYGVMDFGLSVATQRSIAQALARQDTQEANVAVVTSFVMFCGVSLLIVLATLIVAAAGGLIVDESRVSDFRMTIGFLAASLVFLFPTYAVNGIYTANFRYEITSAVHLIRVLLRSVLIYVAVSRGGGLFALAAITTFTDVMAGVVIMMIAKRLAPWLQWRRSYFRAGRLKEMFDFGGAYLFSSLCDRGRYALPSLAMNATVGLAGVTLFGVAQQIYDYFVLFLSNIFGVFQPLFVRQQSSNSHGANAHDFLVVTQLGIGVAVVMAVGAVACAPDFIQAWLGPRFERSSGPLFVLILMGVFHTSLQSNAQLLLAYSRHRILALLNGAEVLVSLALLWPLGRAFQMEGIAAAMLLPAVISRLVIQPLLLRSALPVDLRRYAWIVARAALVLAVLCAVIVYLRPHVPGAGYAKAVAMGVIAAVLVLPGVWLLCFDRQVRARVFTLIGSTVMRKATS